MLWTSKQSFDLIKVESKLDFGALGAGETPVLIPNTEVKPSSGEHTAQAGK